MLARLILCLRMLNEKAPEAETSEQLAEGITDKKGFAKRWLFSVRHVDNLIRMGLPHLAIGRRRVRINIPEADAWMTQTFRVKKRLQAGAVKLSAKPRQ